MRLKILFMTLVVMVTGLGISTPTQAQDPCSGLVPTRLTVGVTARVVYDGDGLGSALRDNPGKEQSGSQLVGNIAEGTVVTMRRGPICLDGIVWWSVALSDGREFWIGEGDSQRYFLEPFTLETELMSTRQESPRAIERWAISYSGNARRLDDMPVPAPEPIVARDRWQPADINAANDALNIRLAQCPDVLVGTPWEGLSNAADVVVDELPFEIIPAPVGARAILVRHWLLQMPTCGGAPGRYYGISTVNLIRADRDIIELFPFGQHGGTRSRQACLSPDVTDQAWTTFLSEQVWSPDSDTLALTVRYLDSDPANPERDCAFYYLFLIDVFNVQITPVAEARRPFWGGGGTRLYYFTFASDNAYNVLSEQLWLLSETQSTPVNVSESAQGVEFVPGVFNSTGVRLPATEDGSQILACNYATGCPEVVEFNISRRTFSEPLAIPDGLAPREIADVHYIDNDMRLLWRTVDGRLFIQSLSGPDRNYFQQVNGSWPPSAQIVDIHLVPTGIAAVLTLNNDERWLLNTASLGLQPLITE